MAVSATASRVIAEPAALATLPSCQHRRADASSSLSPAAIALRDAAGGSAGAPSGPFVAQADAAEVTLGLHGTGFTGPDAETARLAVALQLNLQAETGGGRVKKSETRGERRVDFADDGVVHPTAKRLADRLLASLSDVSADTSEDWAVVRTAR